MNYRIHLHTKEQLDEYGLTSEAFIVKRTENIKSLSIIFGALDNHLSDEVFKYRILETIKIILNDQEDMLHGAISKYITFNDKPT